MDYAAIIELIGKGLTVIEALIEAGQAAAPAIQAIRNLVSGTESGTVTDDDLAQTEALLDQMIADFNLDLPPEAEEE
jgi:hypothetical protein